MKLLTQSQAIKSVRKSWDFNPSSRKIESKKVYDRKKFKAWKD